jgi:peptide/nickel transport system substrate-binding protein
LNEIMRGLWLAGLTAVALAVAGCGGDDEAKKGGTLTVMAESDIQFMDPGTMYYQFDYMVLAQPGHRALYGWKAGDTKPVPDLATALPEVSDGGRTLRIPIRRGVRFSPPVNREVTSADVKYAIERIFLEQVQNGYASTYFAGIEGNEEFTKGEADEVKGIETPDPQTIVLKLTEPSPALASGNALALPGTAPVPKDYAAKFDKGKASTYGQNVVFTGPYMVRNDKSGKITGYQPGKQIELVRNPNWKRETDYREANLDRIVVSLGNDSTVASRRILSGRSFVSGDFAAPPTPILKEALDKRKDQIDVVPNGGTRYVSLNTKVEPLDDVNVRRAIAAVTDREELRLTRGGETIGEIANHFIPPDIPGFEEAGGKAGPGFDFYRNPKGDVELAKEYLRKAGFESGMYEGPELLAVADDEVPASRTAEAFQAQLERIGIRLKMRQVPHDTMLSQFCQVPKAAVAVCPNFAWGKDFYDPQVFIAPLFSGEGIVESNNYNHAQLDDPALNKRIEDAGPIGEPRERARVYGQLDRDITEQVAVIPWLWDNQVNIQSSNVNGVINAFNSSYDLNFTSIE